MNFLISWQDSAIPPHRQKSKMQEPALFDQLDRGWHRSYPGIGEKEKSERLTALPRWFTFFQQRGMLGQDSFPDASKVAHKTVSAGSFTGLSVNFAETWVVA